MAFLRFTLRQLETFVCVAELRSFAGAAERLGMTPQAVSQLIAELEKVLSFRLFDRSTRKVSLSAAGSDFFASVQTTMRHARACESTASDVRNRAAGVVRIGAPLVLASRALPAAIKAYGLTHPKVVVRIRDLPVEMLADAVAAGDVDLALGPDRPVGTDVRRQAMFESRWVLFCSPDHVLASRARVTWHDLHDIHLVASGRDHERSVLPMHANAPEALRISPVEIVDNITTALGMAEQGLAATLAPAYVGCLARHYGLKTCNVEDPETLRSVCLYQSTVRNLSPAADGFAEFLGPWLKEWASQL
ncbi:LysR family transcriptional regulator [Pseudomonas juntendi]|uniref:LysR family transcriptional regulator n=1 Tax=Pseudomonas TaxID=286 RepID=UPI000D9798A6|nr:MULTISPECIES: LysR family transcriptional regulator [Pseudomonas]MBH3385696.1 LysR family transcriptional regulator [Pseudomonas juntendi]PYC08167.1 LysR family transcriptional regulator [Pseudomonas sp. MB-090624]